jgi:hypothetical protein
MFRIRHDSGVEYNAMSQTLLGAKRQASEDMTFGGGHVYVTDTDSGQVWTRQQWRCYSRFGWRKWERVV